MARNTIARIAFVAAALLAVAMLLSSCGAWDVHAAAAPGDASDCCCVGVHEGTAAKQVGAVPPAKGGEMFLLAPVFRRLAGYLPPSAVSHLVSETLPRSSFYVRSARIRC